MRQQRRSADSIEALGAVVVPAARCHNLSFTERRSWIVELCFNGFLARVRGRLHGVARYLD